MRYVSVKNSFEFNFLFSANPSLKWTIFVSNFKNQLICLPLFNAIYVRCDVLKSVGSGCRRFRF